MTHRLSAVQFTFQSCHLKGRKRENESAEGEGDGVCAETMVSACVKKDFHFDLVVSGLRTNPKAEPFQLRSKP